MPRQRKSIVPVERVQERILLIRGQRIILGVDLARLYRVTAKAFNQAVRRNSDRFPEDFMFQLSWEETEDLSQNSFASLANIRSRSQIVTLKRGGNVKYRPYAFTEHGAIMAATILNSKEAVKASLFVVRAFVKLRELLSTHQQLSQKLAELEQKIQGHDDQIVAIVDAIRELMNEEESPPKPPIGFHTEIAGPGNILARRRRAKAGSSKR